MTNLVSKFLPDKCGNNRQTDKRSQHLPGNHVFWSSKRKDNFLLPAVSIWKEQKCKQNWL